MCVYVCVYARGEYRRTWKLAALPYFKILSYNFIGEIEENSEKIRIWLPGLLSKLRSRDLPNKKII
jgi:hypothetical protein